MRGRGDGFLGRGLGLARQWANMVRNETLFPARLKSMNFPEGTTFDASKTVIYGNWTVSFAEPAPVVQQIKGAPNGGLQVVHLNCTNPVLGTHPCTFSVMAAYGKPVRNGQGGGAPFDNCRVFREDLPI